METEQDLPEITRPEIQTFVRFFNSLSQPNERTIRFFERNENDKTYYTCHGQDATYIAQQVFKTKNVIKTWTAGAGEELETTSISKNSAENFLREALLHQQLHIEIWTQLKNTSTWQISQKASPGNLQDVEDLLFSKTGMAISPVVLAVKLSSTKNNKVVGVAFADVSTKEIGVSEFLDDNLYSNFESFIIQLGVKECIVPEDEGGKDGELQRLKNILQRCNISITEKKKADFNSKDIVQTLDRLMNMELSVSTLPEIDMRAAMDSCACLIKYLSLLNDSDNFKRFNLRHHDLSQYMRLGGSALNALNLMPGVHEGLKQTTHLYGLLNQCNTAQGSRLLARWLKQPLLNLEHIGQRHDILQVFLEDSVLLHTLRDELLKKVPDMNRLSKRFQKRNANLEDVYRVYQVVVLLPLFLECLTDHLPMDSEKSDLIQKTFIDIIARYNEEMATIKQLVEDTIDLDAIQNHEFILKPQLNEELTDINNRIGMKKNMIDNIHHTVARDLQLDTEKGLKLEKHSMYGYCLRIIKSSSAKIRNKPAYIEYSVQKSCTYFTTPQLKQLNNDINDMDLEYQRCQGLLVADIIDTVAGFYDTFESLGNVIAHMDVLASFAYASMIAPEPYTRPTMTPMGEGNVILREARHPCLENQDDVSFIANDVVMVRDESEFLIITGPNMGGKSTYIRQIGVITLMAQIGCFVPCKEATLCVFDSILSRVGAGDYQLKGVSTFMAEMLETSTILKSATRNSLIIIDELGRGTGTADGFGLAWAISEYISTEIRAFCLFATHFHELTTLPEKVPWIKNLNVAVEVCEENGKTQEIALLYKVKQGVCDESFGIHVAEMANFPADTVDLARQRLKELEGKSDTELTRAYTAQDLENGTMLENRYMAELGEIVHRPGATDDEINQGIISLNGKYRPLFEQNPYLRDFHLTT
ncbi:putative DNA mismatch repair protein MSH2 [Phycomyces nitens]|nr:putative DNA mismatch repair protein MSH2 [Phycomyces nitens]